MNFDTLKAYLLARAQEASTWRGLILIATAFGVGIDPQRQEAIVALGMGLAGGIGALFPDVK